MAPDSEQPRSLNAIKLLSKENNFTLDKMIATGYNTHLAAFDLMLPPMLTADNDLQNKITQIADLDEAIKILRAWNRESSVTSVATTLAIEWASKMLANPPQSDEERKDAIKRFEMVAKNVPIQKQLQYLQEVIKDLGSSFGNWRVQWGDINRYQRLNSDIQQKYDDNKPSFAVGMASSAWGCLPSFGSVKPSDTKKRYGVNGNSFVAAVEFGKRVKAKSIVTGGEGMDPSSKHFLDQTEGYLTGKFKDVLFYKEDVLKHVERKYHPGE